MPSARDASSDSHLPREGAAVARARWTLVLRAFVLAVAALATLAYSLHAARLVAYPWDWSPDEGLYLDYARRLVEDPGGLYGERVVPFPSFYGPLLPALLAPLRRLPQPFFAVRVLALLWTFLGAAALALIVRRRAGTLWAAAAVALYLAPFDLSFWHMLLRTDGLMNALWLCAAAVLLPRELARGADTLGTRRLVAGVTLVILSALVKQTALVHAAPLVLGWFLVDRRSAWRLSSGVALAGLAALAVLQLLTSGGFLWVNGLWGLHARVDGQTTGILMYFLVLSWPVLTLAVLLFFAAMAAGRRPLRNPALLLAAGGLAAVPLLGKHGAGWNYLIPLFAGLVLVATTCFDSGPRLELASRRSLVVPAALVTASAVALGLVTTRHFPAPGRLDELTARAFYAYTQEVRHRAGGPFLVANPDLVYWLASQPVEIEGTSFIHLEMARVPGTEQVLRRLREHEYTLVVETWRLPEAPAWRQALRAGYRHVGGCRLGWYFGSYVTHLHLRSDLPIDFHPPAGTRCAEAAPGSTPGDEHYR